MATHSTLSELFTATADAIRAKTGSTEKIVADDFPATIDTIVTLNEGTKDADATAADIASGKTAYVNGARVTGNLNVSGSGSIVSVGFDGMAHNSNNDTSVQVYGKFSFDRLMRANSETSMSIPYTNFGDATAADVVSGKTFTSAAGLKVTGTASLGSSVAGTLCHSKTFEAIMGWTLVPAIFKSLHNS